MLLRSPEGDFVEEQAQDSYLYPNAGKHRKYGKNFWYPEKYLVKRNAEVIDFGFWLSQDVQLPEYHEQSGATSASD